MAGWYGGGWGQIVADIPNATPILVHLDTDSFDVKCLGRAYEFGHGELCFEDGTTFERDRCALIGVKAAFTQTVLSMPSIVSMSGLSSLITAMSLRLSPHLPRVLSQGLALLVDKRVTPSELSKLIHLLSITSEGSVVSANHLV